MATRQLVKPTSTNNATTQVTLTQSREMVKTLLFVSTSTVLTGRSLFSERHFEPLSIQPFKGLPFSYKSFIEQNPVRQNGKGFYCLARGRSTAADKFLNWLENSVFHAMEREYLDCFQLRVFEDPEHPDDVLETWTFRVTYPDETGRAPKVSGIEIERKDGMPITLADAQANIRETVRSINQATNLMRYLPMQRYLSIYFFYNEKCDSNYMAPGHEDCIVDQINFPPEGACKLETSILRPYQDGVHAFQVATTYIGIDSEVDYIDGNMVCNQKRSAFADLDALEAAATTVEPQLQVSASKAASQHATEATRKISGPTSLPQAAVDDSPGSPAPIVRGAAIPPDGNVVKQNEPDAMDVDPSNIQALDPTFQGAQQLNIKEMSLGNPNSQEQRSSFPQGSQMSIVPQDEHVAQELHNMKQAIHTNASFVGSTQVRDNRVLMPPARPRMTQTDTLAGFANDSLDTLHQPDRLFGESAIPAHPSLGADSLLEPQTQSEPRIDLEDSASILPLSFTSQCLDQLARRRSRSQKRSATAKPLKATRSQASQQINNSDATVVDCECGTLQNEDDMLHCHYCDTRQHFECYGYVSSVDQRVPEVHACYSCLLPLDKDKSSLTELKNLALERRIVHIIKIQGYTTDGVLEKALGLNSLSTVKSATTKLKSKGFLVSATPANSHKKKVWHLAKAGPNCEKLKEELFDPTRKIIHMFAKKSLVSPEPLASNYLGNTTDPLIRLSSASTGDRLGHSPLRVNISSNIIRNTAMEMENQEMVQVPRTPTNKRGWSTDDETEGSRTYSRRRPKRRAGRTSKTKDYVNAAGGQT